MQADEVATARLVLPPAPESSRAARQFCAKQLAGTAGDTVDSVTLLVSELVTNAVLHAMSEVVVSVARNASWVRVDVQDRSPLLPTPREYGATGVTGRGLGLVELLATEHGVEAHPGGKTVWFTLALGDQTDVAPDRPLPSDERPPPPDEAAAGDEVLVTLRGLPLTLYLVLQEQNDALLREYALLHLRETGQPPAPAADTSRLAAAERAQGRLAGTVAAAASQAQGEHLDVSMRVPRDGLADFDDLRAVLGDALVLAARGRLLARPALPELRALRTWCLDQVTAAAAGEPGTAWEGATEVLDDDLALPLAVFDASTALDPHRAALAADDGNRILAVTPPAAELLGWEVDELVGQRLVAIIPPRLREAHVASFTRLLLSGEPRLLGRPVQLPALRRDGSEVELSVVITNLRTSDGRLVFVAEFTPLATSAGGA